MTLSVRLTGRANRWIHLLQDFGHLDQESTDRLLITVAELHAEFGGPPDGWVDLPLVRRAAAVLLTSNEDGVLPHILEEDWLLLFG